MTETTETTTPSRTLKKTFHGNDAAELEAAALAEAAEVFGPGTPLEVIPDYVVQPGGYQATRKYAAVITVRAL